MASLIQRLVGRFFHDDPGPNIMFLGLDYSGKTTFLYKLKLDEIVTTIPSIGFNVETLKVATINRKSFQMTGWDIGGGCGGPRFLEHILHFYMEGSDGIIWMVDSTDAERLGESVEFLQRIVRADVDELERRQGKPKMFPILILANKCDLPASLPLERIRSAFQPVTFGRLASVYPISVINGTGFPVAFDWLSTAVQVFKAKNKSNAAAAPAISPPSSTAQDAAQSNPRSSSVLAQKLVTWLTRADTDLPPEEFLARFEAYDLPTWDHYVHIRIAYLLLSKYGRQEGKDRIFKGLENYIANSSQTRGRTFHTSMTYFWIQIVHFGMRNTPPPSFISIPEPEEEKATAGPTKKHFDDFSRFLLINPYVVDGTLWEDYYSRDVLMTPKAKEEMVLPDKKPLPSLVVRDAITTFGK